MKTGISTLLFLPALATSVSADNDLVRENIRNLQFTPAPTPPPVETKAPKAPKAPKATKVPKVPKTKAPKAAWD